MVLRELKGSYKWLIDEEGHVKTGRDLELAVENKLKNQVDQATYWMQQFTEIADKDTLQRMQAHYFAYKINEPKFSQSPDKAQTAQEFEVVQL